MSRCKHDNFSGYCDECNPNWENELNTENNKAELQDVIYAKGVARGREQLRTELDASEAKVKELENRIDTTSILYRTLGNMYDEKKADIANIKNAFGRECYDVDIILQKIGLTPVDARTETGCLKVSMITNHLQETYDALHAVDAFGKEMTTKYAAVCKILAANNITNMV